MNNLNEIELNVRDRVQLENLHISTVVQGGGGGGSIGLEVIYDEELQKDVLQCTPRELKALLDENKSIFAYSKQGNFEQANSFWIYDTYIFIGFSKSISPQGVTSYIIGFLTYTTGSGRIMPFMSSDLDEKFTYESLT